MKIIGVIPARYQSTRFAGKVLAEINGKPMIQHVYEQTKKCKWLKDVIIACDDPRVQQVADNFGATTVMTDPDHVSGSDRIVEAIKSVPCDMVINVQGDEPLIQASVINQLVDVMVHDDSLVMGTVIKAIQDKTDLDDPNVVKVVVNQRQEAMYFSRARIPYERNHEGLVYCKHLGIYAYTRDFLLEYSNMPKSKIELTESLEQLRVLDAGYKIKTVTTDIETIGVDTPADLIKVEQYMREHIQL